MAENQSFRPPDPRLRRGPTLIVNVCFHGIGTPDRELEPGEDKYWISTELFADQ